MSTPERPAEVPAQPAPVCPHCDGLYAEWLGPLGAVRWWRCASCRWAFHPAMCAPNETETDQPN